MKESQPSISDWRKLYSAAAEFKEIACWDWMLDTDMFGVQDPVSGEIGYCCVMGYLGEHFALGLYLGTEGLETYLKIRNREITENDFSIHTVQKCLMASFEDREFVTNEDREIMKKLNLKFRGRNQWPLFRIYEPGYPPWHLSKNQVKYLILALQQTVEVALRFEEDPDMLDAPKRNHYLVRVPKKAGSKLQWEDKWLRPVPLKKSKIVVPPIDEIRLQRIKRDVRHRAGTWEADFFFAPTPIQEGKDERPYYPHAMLYMDTYSEMILSIDMAKPGDYITQFANGLMNIMENAEAIPSQILVMREEAFELLKLIASRLNINLKLVERLEATEDAQASMLQFFFR